MSGRAMTNVTGRAIHTRVLYGTCPECGYRIRLRKDKTVQLHALWRVGGIKIYCKGSYQMNEHQEANDAARRTHVGRD